MDDNQRQIKLGHVVSWKATDSDLLFLKQIGLSWVRLDYGLEKPREQHLQEVQRRFSSFGLQIYSAWHFSYRSLKIQLGQAGRDEDIEAFCSFIRILGKMGIGVAPIDFHPANTYTTGSIERRGYMAREFSEDDFRSKIEKNRFEREYSAAEIWEYYTYFIDAVLPVAEEAGVVLALHPDDPPLVQMNGVAKLFVDYDGYHRAEEIAAGSEYWGLRLCVGTWAEGGKYMGKDVFGMITDFGERGKIHEVDFRNVSRPLPCFQETFPDDGYVDMARVMSALVRSGFTGMVVPDHIPKLQSDEETNSAGIAYCIAYMRALIQRSEEEADDG